MVIIITGATHTGKTCLAQHLLERFHYPYLSQDHLKMGLIRSGQTTLTPEDDREMTGFLWPIVREMIKTAIENEQNLIVEGCYVPFDWKKDFEQQYMKNIQYICLAFSDEYIDKYIDSIKAHGSDLENRLDDSYCTKEALKTDNHFFIQGCEANHLEVTLLDGGCEYSILQSRIEAKL